MKKNIACWRLLIVVLWLVVLSECMFDITFDVLRKAWEFDGMGKEYATDCMTMLCKTCINHIGTSEHRRWYASDTSKAQQAAIAYWYRSPETEYSIENADSSVTVAAPHFI